MLPHRQPKENVQASVSKHLPVVSKCLAIVLLPKENRARTNAQDANRGETKGRAVHSGRNKNTDPAAHDPVLTGKQILEDFKRQNQTCYWNPALIESIRQLEYLGFVEPCTVLVSGEDIHLENLRSAWGRRVLKAPSNFSIDRIGDVSGIEMQVIPQTQFMPLPDSLCLAVTELNQTGQTATLESIRARLQRWYSKGNVPATQRIHDVLNQLIRQRKIFHNGSGYCVITPDTYRLHAVDPTSLACTASWLPYHPMYVPVFPQQQQQPGRTTTRSISCQVTQVEEKQGAEGSRQASDKKPVKARSQSVRACRERDQTVRPGTEKIPNFTRSLSARSSTDKAKPTFNKALSEKTALRSQGKGKGEKVSLFSKIFGRRKKKSSSRGAASSSSEGGSLTTDVEFATFSGQFPPPEWIWYQQQLERQRRTEEWVTRQLTKSATWEQFRSASMVPASEYTSIEPAQTELSYPPTRHQTFNRQKYVLRSHAHDYPTRFGNGQVLAGVRERTRGVEEVQKKKQQQLMNCSHVQQDFTHPQRDRYRHQMKNQAYQYEYHVPVEERAVPRAHVSAYSPEEDNFYSAPISTQYRYLVPWHSMPCYDVPDKTSSQANGRHVVYSPSPQQEELSDTGNAPLYHPQPHFNHRRVHRSQLRAPEVCTLHETGAFSDISIEYNGRMLKKNSRVHQSRDSGVNCAGLPQIRERCIPQTDQEFTACLHSEDDHVTYSNAPAPASSHAHCHLSAQREAPLTSGEEHSLDEFSRRQAGASNITGSLPGNNTETNTLSPACEVLAHNICESSRLRAGAKEFPEDHWTEKAAPPQSTNQSVCERESHQITLQCVGGNHHGLSQESAGGCCLGEGVDPDAVDLGSDLTQQCDSMHCDSFTEKSLEDGEMRRLQTKPNHLQVPQLVLDTESRGDYSNLTSKPDIAVSSGGSRDASNRAVLSTHREETVTCSLQQGALISKDQGQLSESDKMTQQGQITTAKSEPDPGGREVVERCVVSHLGIEFQDLGMADSGFSSPRDNPKDNQRQHLQTDKTASSPHYQKSPRKNEIECPTVRDKVRHVKTKIITKENGNALSEQSQVVRNDDYYTNANTPHGAKNCDYAPCPVHNTRPHPTAYPRGLQHSPNSLFQRPSPSPSQHQHVPRQQRTTSQPHNSANKQIRHHHLGKPQTGSRDHTRTHDEKRLPEDIKHFQEQQVRGTKFGLNGEFEVVGVV